MIYSGVLKPWYAYHSSNRTDYTCEFVKTITLLGAKGNRDLRISDLVKTLMELTINPYDEFW